MTEFTNLKNFQSLKTDKIYEFTKFTNLQN